MAISKCFHHEWPFFWFGLLFLLGASGFCSDENPDAPKIGTFHGFFAETKPWSDSEQVEIYLVFSGDPGPFSQHVDYNAGLVKLGFPRTRYLKDPQLEMPIPRPLDTIVVDEIGGNDDAQSGTDAPQTFIDFRFLAMPPVSISTRSNFVSVSYVHLPSIETPQVVSSPLPWLRFSLNITAAAVTAGFALGGYVTDRHLHDVYRNEYQPGRDAYENAPTDSLYASLKSLEREMKRLSVGRNTWYGLSIGTGTLALSANIFLPRLRKSKRHAS